MHMTHMDAYTIMFQAKAHMTEDKKMKTIIESKSGESLDVEAIRRIAIRSLEKGINVIHYEYPPSVSKRIRNYYNTHKDTLVDTFSNKVKEVISSYNQ